MVMRLTDPPNLMVWLPLVNVALSSPVHVRVFRPCGRKFGLGSVNGRVVSSSTKDPNFWPVVKVAGAKLNPNRASFVIVPGGLHRQESDRHLVESLFCTSGTVS